MTVAVEPFSLSLSRPLETAAGTIEKREGFLVRLEHAGVEGVGEATPLSGWTEPIGDCEATLRALDDPESALQDGRLDAAPAARHGVSLALLDARARTADSPLYRYLVAAFGFGRRQRIEHVPVNATVGDGSPTATATAVESAVDDGFTAVKVKVGARSLAVDLERLEAVRKRCPDVELRADANGAWDHPTATRALSAFADLDVTFVEQPLPAADLEGHTALCAADDPDRVDVALDEGVVEHGIEAILEAAAADVLVCKPMALGGLDRTLEAAMYARAAGVEPLVTTTIDGAVARAGAVHLAASVPDLRACGLATRAFLETDLRAGIAPVENGAVSVPQGKGNIPPR